MANVREIAAIGPTIGAQLKAALDNKERTPFERAVEHELARILRSLSTLSSMVADNSSYVLLNDSADVVGLGLGALGTALTIATGAITVVNSNHKIDTEAAAASDDLDTINGGYDGMLLALSAVDDARTVVLKHGTGNIFLHGAADFSLDNTLDQQLLIKRGSNWIALAPGANNGA